MRIFIGGFLLGLGLLVIGCAAMQENTRMNNLTDEEIEAYNADPNNVDKIVCRKDKPIGSNIPRRVCEKQSYADDRTAQDRRAVEEMQRNANIIPGPQ